MLLSYSKSKYRLFILYRGEYKMERKSLEAKKKLKAEKRQIKNEREVQCFLKYFHERSEFGLRYSVGFFRRNSPKAVEERRKAEIEHLKQILADYEARGAKNENDKT